MSTKQGIVDILSKLQNMLYSSFDFCFFRTLSVDSYPPVRFWGVGVAGTASPHPHRWSRHGFRFARPTAPTVVDATRIEVIRKSEPQRTTHPLFLHLCFAFLYKTMHLFPVRNHALVVQAVYKILLSR